MHNIIDMGRGCAHITCDHRMQWIWTGNYENQIKNMKCRDGTRLTGNDLKDRKSGSTSLSPTLHTSTQSNKKAQNNHSNNSMRALNVDENE